MTERKVAELIDRGHTDDESGVSTEERLAHFFGELPDDRSVGIYEVDPEKPLKVSFLFSIQASQLPAPHELFEQILDKWGPGEYEASARDENGRIAFKVRFNLGTSRDRRASLIPSRPSRDDERQAPSSAPPSTLPPEFAQILANQQRTLDLIADRLSQQPQPKDTVEVARELMTLKELFATPPPPAPTQNTIEMFKDFIAMRDMLSDLGDGDSDPLTAAIKTLGPAITSAIEQLQHSGNTRTGRTAPGAAQAIRKPPAASSKTEENFMLSMAIGQLVGMAERQADVSDGVTSVVNALQSMPAGVRDRVIDFLDDEESVNNLIAIDARVEPHRAWFDQVIDGMLTQLFPGDGDPEAPSGSTGAEKKDASDQASEGG